MTPQALLGGKASEAYSWLMRVREGTKATEATSSEFNWHGFAESAAAKSRVDAQNNELENAQAWALIAITVYRTLAMESTDGFSFEYSAMNLRAWLIRRLGAQCGHPVRDSRDITRWFLEGKTMSVDQVTVAAEELRSRPMDQWAEHIDFFRNLRRIKNQLNVFRVLDEADIDPEIQEWLRIRELLP